MRIKLDIPIPLSEITGNESEIVIRYISTDTRTLCSGDLFVPLHGDRYDGADFLNEAAELGAIIANTNAGDRFLLGLAKLYKSKLKRLKYTVGITGSVGKTTAKEFIYKIASGQHKVHKTESNENNIIGVAKTILSAPDDTEILVLEIGTNHPGEIKNITDIISPDIALITRIGSAHIGNFGTREEICKEKLSIAASNQTRLITRYEDKLGGYSFSADNSLADCLVKADNSSLSIFEMGKLLLRTKCIFREKYLLFELAAAVSVCLAMGVSSEAIKEGVFSLSYDNTRQNVYSVGKFHIYSDCYNASLESFCASFEALNGMKNFIFHSAVIGEIDELGDMKETIHYELGRIASAYPLRRIYLLGESLQSFKRGFIDGGGNEEILLPIDDMDDKKRADTIIQGALNDEIILFKASRRMHLETIIDEIKRRCEA